MHLVIFDFDGTIHLEETPRIFLRVLSQDQGMRKKIRKFYISMSWVYILYRFGLCRQLAIRRVLSGIVKMMCGMSETQIDGFFKQCLELARESFSPISLSRLKAHLESNDQILLLSGAFSQFIALVARDLGMNSWLGTEIEIIDGVCTGQITSIMNGPSKVQALRTFLQKQTEAGVIFDMGEAYAYADSIYDLPLLMLCGHPVAVNPDQELLKEAKLRGWEIIWDGACQLKGKKIKN
ncbi:Phosphoserine phosphatase [Desulfosporosinus sp. I2]|uniref:HAD family hydrolase n=1 Tax=Desulfosporosinus sp. I2 TaxID=1617025 RepID=UPI0005ED8B60|nr:HAD family phosphatase [Desulfosporosinus sp. I2]KJR49521.1 Phosphoserine phosphatase [Desulfosporosinus sp. I2]